MTGEPIPLNSDITFELDVLKCGEKPYRPGPDYNNQPHTTTLQDDQCFYLHSGVGAGSGTKDFVLSTIEDNGKRVLNIEHKVEDEEEQMWFFDQKTGSLRNAAHPKLRVDAGAANGVLTLSAEDNKNFDQNDFDWILSN